MAIEIVSFLKKHVIFHSFLYVYQRVCLTPNDKATGPWQTLRFILEEDQSDCLLECASHIQVVYNPYIYIIYITLW